ncbi:hypothetical protein C8R44DRAFT_885574 [Mycena epipterygia]|nr:hypothetical protein C8R44DRAFT_885574 [Mycena epipterygia]
MQNLNHPVPSTPRSLVRHSLNLCLLGRYAFDGRACRQANEPQASSDHIPFTFVGDSALNSDQVSTPWHVRPGIIHPPARHQPKKGTQASNRVGVRQRINRQIAI